MEDLGSFASWSRRRNADTSRAAKGRVDMYTADVEYDALRDRSGRGGMAA